MSSANASRGHAPEWVGTWASGPQLTEPGNLPPAPGLSGNTLRQVVRVSIGGSRARLRLSNEFGDGRVVLRAVHVAISKGASLIDEKRQVALRFGGASSITIPAGEAVFSDAFELDMAPLSDLAISLHIAEVPRDVTGHPGSRTTSYLAVGDVVAASSLESAVKTEHWYYIAGLDVLAEAAAAVVVLGDSISDGRGSITDANNRWPDILSRRLRANAATANVAVLNQGIGGNAVVSGGLGPTAVQRFERDVLNQCGARWLIVLEGVNDIGNSASADVADALIAAFERFIALAHERDIRVYGVPILPFGGSQYDSEEHERARQRVNRWIRESRELDAVLDLEAAVRDPLRPNWLHPSYDCGDHLHLGPAGYARMAEAVDLALFR